MPESVANKQSSARRESLAAELDKFDAEGNYNDDNDESQTDDSQVIDKLTKPVEDDESQQAEPQSDVDDEADESDISTVVEELASKEELTLADLRKLPGTADMSDEELQAAWADANKPEPVKPDGFKLYAEDGTEIADLNGMSAVDFLKHQFGYSVRGKEQKKAFKDLLRTAVNGHYNEGKVQSLVSERDLALNTSREVAARVAQFEERERLVVYALRQLQQGNEQPIRELLTRMDQPLPPVQQQTVSAEQAQNDAAGQRVWYEVVVPRVNKMAEQYGLSPDQVEQVVAEAIRAEPGEFLTEDKLEDILGYEVPQRLEGLQTRNGDGNSAELKRMAAELATLKAQMKNAATDRKRNRNKKLPSGGRGRGALTAGNDLMPDEAVASRAAMKKWLRE